MSTLSHWGKKLRLIIIDNPYELMDDQLVSNLLPKIFKLKIDGYFARYGEGILPLDTFDFIATHFIVAIEDNGFFNPIMSYKMVTLSRAEVFRQNFPILNLTNGENNNVHREVISSIIEKCRTRNDEISYIGSFTISPLSYKDASLREDLKKLMIISHYHYSVENGINHGLAGITTRFKAGELLYFLGYRPLEKDGMLLAPVIVPSFFDEKSQLNYLNEFTPEAKSLSMELQSYWKDSIFLDKRKIERKVA